MLFLSSLCISTAFAQSFNISTNSSWDTTNLCSGTLYDGGGATSNYATYSYGYFVIDPPGNNTVSLTFSQFDLGWGDYVYLYDGVGTGSYIGSYSGTTLPNSGLAINSTSDAITVYFTSNYSTTGPGFAVNWNTSASSIPSANFSISNNNPAFNRQVSFTNTTTNGAISEWHFGDGTISTETDAIHQYTSSGVFNAYLVSTNCLGSDTSVVQSVNVQTAPTYSFNPDSLFTTVACGNTITASFDITHSSGGTLFYDIDAQESGLSPYVFEEDFETGLGNFTLDASASTSFTAAVQLGSAASGNGAVNLNGTTNAYDGIYGNFASSQPLEISYSVKPVSSGFHGLISIGDSPQTTSRDMFYAYMNFGQIRILTWFGTYSFNVNNNQWNLIELKNINWTNHTYDVWINGSLAQAALSFNDINTNSINEIHLWNSGFVNCGYDDIKVKTLNIAPITLVPSNGVLSSSNSNTISLSGSTAGRVAGTYQYDIKVATNATGADSLKILPWIVTITGTPTVNLDKNCIDFSNVFQNLNYTDSIRIVNTGCDSLDITSITTTNSDFVLSNSILVVQPFDTVWLNVDFIPSTIGTYTDTIHLLTNAGDTSICLTASSVGAPVVTTDSSSYSRTYVGCLDSVPFDFQVINTGLSTLDWSISAKGLNTHFDDFENGFNSSLWSSFGTNTINSSCGVNSGTQSLNFNGGTRIATTNSINLSIGDSIVFWAHPGNSSSPCEAPNSGENLFLEYSTNGFSWINIGTVSYFNSPQYYRYVSPIGGSVQLRLIQYSYTGSSIDNYSVDDFRIGKSSTSDGNFMPGSGTTAANDTVNITGYFNTEGLTSGIYTRTVVVRSNDPIDSIYSFDVTLNIFGVPNIIVPSTCVNMDTLLVGNTTQDSVQIVNTGCDALNISSITSTNSDFTLSHSSLIIQPEDTAYLWIDFVPSSPNVYVDTVHLLTNDVDTFMCLTGVSIGAPIIQTDSTSYSRYFTQCQDSVPFDFQLINTGLSNLSWNIQGTGGSVNQVDDFENGMNTSIWTSFGANAIIQACNVNSGINGLSIDGNGSRFAVTKTFNVSANDSIKFWAFPGNSGSGSGCENPDGGEDLNIEYSTDGVVWTNMGTVFNYNTVGQNYSFACPVSGQIQFRLAQYSHSGAGYDNFIVDDFSVGSGLSGTFNPNSGNTAVNDTVFISGWFNTSGLSAGTYSRTITIVSNDPLTPELIIPVTLVINGTAEIVLDTINCLNYTNVLQGSTAMDTVWIYNTGCDSLKLTGSTNTLSDFTLNTPLPKSIAVGDSLPLIVNFSPITVGSFTDTLIVLNNDKNVSICLSGTSAGAPLMKLLGDSIVTEVNKCQIIKTENYLVENIGQGPLDYNIKIGEYRNSNREYYNTSGATTVHSFQNTPKQADTIEIKVILNGDFATFGQRSTLYINNLYYSQVYDNNLSMQNDTLTFTISGFNASNYTNNDSLRISLTNTFSVTGATGSFHQIEVRVVKNANWVAVTGSSSGNIAANGSKNHNFLFNSAGLSVGRYETVMNIENSQVSSPFVNVPIVMYVISEEIIELSDTCLYFANTFIGDTATQNLVLYNTGCEPLAINSLILTNNVYQINPTSGVIGIDDSLVITVDFLPTLPGNYSASLIVNNSDTTQIICLNGDAIAKPIAGFSYFDDGTCFGKFIFQDTSLYSPTAWFWDFGDGNINTGSNPIHFYQKPGTYNVTLRALNLNGFDTTSIMVTANPLFVDFVMSHDTARVDSTVSFADSSITAASWFWDFDDGTTDTIQNPTHKFTQIGRYDVKLTVTDSRSCVLSETKTIRVINDIGLFESVSSSLNVFAYPNPTNGLLTVSLDEAGAPWVHEMEMTILDVTGRIVKQNIKMEGMSKEIDLSPFQSGIYILQLSRKGSLITSKRIVLEN